MERTTAPGAKLPLLLLVFVDFLLIEMSSCFFCGNRTANKKSERLQKNKAVTYIILIHTDRKWSSTSADYYEVPSRSYVLTTRIFFRFFYHMNSVVLVHVLRARLLLPLVL